MKYIKLKTIGKLLFQCGFRSLLIIMILQLIACNPKDNNSAKDYEVIISQRDTILGETESYEVYISLKSKLDYKINEIYIGKFDSITNKMIGNYDSIIVINNLVGQTGFVKGYKSDVYGAINVTIDNKNKLIPFVYKLKK